MSRLTGNKGWIAYRKSYSDRATFYQNVMISLYHIYQNVGQVEKGRTIDFNEFADGQCDMVTCVILFEAMLQRVVWKLEYRTALFDNRISHMLLYDIEAEQLVDLTAIQFFDCQVVVGSQEEFEEWGYQLDALDGQAQMILQATMTEYLGLVERSRAYESQKINTRTSSRIKPKKRSH